MQVVEATGCNSRGDGVQLTRERGAAVAPEPYLNRQENQSSREAFAEWWALYPRRNGRKVGKQAAAALFAKVPVEDRELLMAATVAYAAGCGDYPKDPERFLRREFWRDWLPDQVPDVSGPAADPECVDCFGHGWVIDAATDVARRCECAIGVVA